MIVYAWHGVKFITNKYYFLDWNVYRARPNNIHETRTFNTIIFVEPLIKTGLKLKSQSQCLDIVIAKLILETSNQSSHYFTITEKLVHFFFLHCHY